MLKWNHKPWAPECFFGRKNIIGKIDLVWLFGAFVKSCISVLLKSSRVILGYCWTVWISKQYNPPQYLDDLKKISMCLLSWNIGYSEINQKKSKKWSILFGICFDKVSAMIRYYANEGLLANYAKESYFCQFQDIWMPAAPHDILFFWTLGFG